MNQGDRKLENELISSNKWKYWIDAEKEFITSSKLLLDILKEKVKKSEVPDENCKQAHLQHLENYKLQLEFCEAQLKQNLKLLKIDQEQYANPMEEPKIITLQNNPSPASVIYENTSPTPPPPPPPSSSPPPSPQAPPLPLSADTNSQQQDSDLVNTSKSSILQNDDKQSPIEENISKQTISKASSRKRPLSFKKESKNTYARIYQKSGTLSKPGGGIK